MSLACFHLQKPKSLHRKLHSHNQHIDVNLYRSSLLPVCEVGYNKKQTYPLWKNLISHFLFLLSEIKTTAQIQSIYKSQPSLHRSAVRHTYIAYIPVHIKHVVKKLVNNFGKSLPKIQ